MREKTPGLILLSLALLSLIISLGLAACGDTSDPTTAAAVATINVRPTTSTVATTSPAQTTVRSTTVTATTVQVTPTQPGKTHNGATATTGGDEQPQQTAVPTPTVPAPTAPVATPTAPAKTGASYPGKIIYDTADQQIFIIKPDGSGRQKVANGFSPLFSPDGQRVAYLTRTDGSPLESRLTVNSINLDGTDHQKLCETSGNVAAKLVRWSPRNRFIALTLTQQDGPGALYLCNVVDGSLNRGITTSQGGVAGAYDWTPDGNNAVWEAGKGTDFNLYYGDPDLGGNGAVALTKGQFRATSEINNFQYYPAARISPDGKTLAVGGGSLYFLALPGQQSRLDKQHYSGAQVQSLAWSPDGRAVVTLALEPALEKPVAVITILDVSGQPLAADPLVLNENIGTSVDWSRQ